jgi:hypothetical protein
MTKDDDYKYAKLDAKVDIARNKSESKASVKKLKMLLGSDKPTGNSAITSNVKSVLNQGRQNLVNNVESPFRKKEGYKNPFMKED